MSSVPDYKPPPELLPGYLEWMEQRYELPMLRVTALTLDAHDRG